MRKLIKCFKTVGIQILNQTNTLMTMWDMRQKAFKAKTTLPKVITEHIIPA